MAIRNPLELYLRQLIEAGCTTIQLGVRGIPSPVGPGKCEAIHPESGMTISRAANDLEYTKQSPALYRITVQAVVPKKSAIKGMPPTPIEVLLPMVINPEDLVFVSEGPKNLDGTAFDTSDGDKPSNGKPAEGSRQPGPPKPNGGGFSIG